MSLQILSAAALTSLSVLPFYSFWPPPPPPSMITLGTPADSGQGTEASIAMNTSKFTLEVSEPLGGTPFTGAEALSARGVFGGAVAGGVYDRGGYPQITGDGNSFGASSAFLEVHQSALNDDVLWYRQLHQSSGPGFWWGQSYLYDTGYYPTAAMASYWGVTRVVEMHDGANEDVRHWVGSNYAATDSGQLWETTGTLESDGTVAWNTHRTEEGGWHASLAMMADGPRAWVVEVHQGFDDGGDDRQMGALWMRTGYLYSTGTTVVWNSAWNYASGARPSIALCVQPNGLVAIVDIHETSAGVVAYRGGWMDRGSGSVTFADPLSQIATNTTGAFHPRVTCAAATGVFLYQQGPDWPYQANTVTQIPFTIH